MKTKKNKHDTSRLRIEIADHRLSNAIEYRYMMNDRSFFRDLCFEIISTKRADEYYAGIRAGLSVAEFPSVLTLWAAHYDEKTYLFNTYPRDMGSLVSYIRDTPFKHKKYKEEQISTVMFKCAKFVDIKHHHSPHIKRIWDVRDMEQAIEWCRGRIRNSPQDHRSRDLHVILNHPMASQEKWKTALELRKMDEVHQ